MRAFNKKLENDLQSQFPLILALNKGGEPLRWINYEDSAFYYAKGKVLWSYGKHNVVLHGGTNALTGKQSILEMDTIIALDSDTSPSKYRNGVSLSNKALFKRDQQICGYCGLHFPLKLLTRDHIHPRGQNGKDTWENVVTACKPCNHGKGNRTPEQAHMPLLYVPYEPTFNEYLILRNKNILADQMEFLIKGVSKQSRLLIN